MSRMQEAENAWPKYRDAHSVNNTPEQRHAFIAGYTAARVVAEEPEWIGPMLDTIRAALDEGLNAIEFIEADRGYMRPWERMVADGDRDAVTVQKAIDLLDAAGAAVKQEGAEGA